MGTHVVISPGDDHLSLVFISNQDYHQLQMRKLAPCCQVLDNYLDVYLFLWRYTQMPFGLFSF